MADVGLLLGLPLDDSDLVVEGPVFR